MTPHYFATPEWLDAAPDPIAELTRGLEDELLEMICSRLKISGELNEVTVQAIRALRSQGIPLGDIKKAIRKYGEISARDLNKLFDDVVERNQKYYSEMVTLAQVTEPLTYVNAADIEMIRKQTLGEFRNITQTMGFLVDNGRTFIDPTKALYWALDSASVQIQSGAVSYNEAIRGAVRQLADSGLKVVRYKSDHHDQIDVAARRAILTGINQLNQKYREESMDYLGTDLVETTAHVGARDTGEGYQNHKSWQGKWYRWSKYPRTSKGDYPDFDEECRPDDVQGIGGANCLHSFYAVIEGVNEPTYTQEQLDNIDPEPFEYEGKTYSIYEATQRQRELERSIRKVKRRKLSAEEIGNEKEAQAASIRLRRLNEKYNAFSKAAGLRRQIERMEVLYR